MGTPSDGKFGYSSSGREADGDWKNEASAPRTTTAHARQGLRPALPGPSNPLTPETPVRLRALILLLAFGSTWTDDIVAGCVPFVVPPSLNELADEEAVEVDADAPKQVDFTQRNLSEIWSVSTLPRQGIWQAPVQKPSLARTTRQRLNELMSLQN